MKRQLVLVAWEDAFVDNLDDEKDIDNITPCIRISAGFIVRNCKRFVVLADCITSEYGVSAIPINADAGWSKVQVIPKRMVKKIECVKKV